MLPFRAKNPPEHFPYVTIGLIAVNTLVYLITSNMGLSIRPEMLRQFAVSHDTLSLSREFTALFLHTNLLHLGGNMLFLWIFAPSVEGRMRWWFFLPAYLLSGMAGGMLHEVIMGQAHPEQFSLGASGAIMGAAGMYLYMFPYSLIRAVHRTYLLAGWFRVSDIQARWVILYFIGFDLLYQLIFQGGDGVGHLAHLGGFAAGVLFALVLRTRRDTVEVSAVQATRSDMKDYTLLSVNQLNTLMQQPHTDMNLVLAYCEKALTSPQGTNPQAALAAVQQNIKALMEQPAHERLAWILLAIHPTMGGVHPLYYLRLASMLEATYSYDYAARLYRRVVELNPSQPDSEAALYRLARLTETVQGNPQQAYALYMDLLRMFPHGEMALEVKTRFHVK